MKKIPLSVLFLLLIFRLANAQSINYVPKFENENHPEIGYWFISPDLIEGDKYLSHLENIAQNCPYTLVFLTSREGANFYNYPVMHPVFQKIVSEAHKRGLKVGLQLWGNYQDKTMEGSQRMIVENEVMLDQSGNANFTATAKYVRFPDRLLRSDLFRVYAFRKTSDGFYDPSTLKDITGQCESVTPDKATVEINIKGGKSAQGLTACIMTQQYCSQSSMWGDMEINGFAEAMKNYSDIPFDGFALDEYGNKFVSREAELKGDDFRGRWYSSAMADEYQKSTGKYLDQTLFDARYAPEGKPEMRMKAINEYMDFMRKGALRVEKAVNLKSREIFGNDIFNGIHNTYHNSLVNDEIWANGIGWWDAPREYGQTDEKTPTPTQMGIAMAHPKNTMYNQYYDANLEPVLVKAFSDLRWGIRTHYHALNDKRPLRFDLEFPEARFKAILEKATVKGYSVDALPQLRISKNLLPDGCKNEDGSFVFTDESSLRTDKISSFSVNLDGDLYTGKYKGLAIIAADKKSGLKKLAAAGFSELTHNGKPILAFKDPVDIFIEKVNGQYKITVADPSKSVLPLINKL